MVTSSSLLSTDASALAFTPLYVQFNVPALRISTKLTFKLKPGGAKRIFSAIEDVVASFTDNLHDDLASVDQNHISQEFSAMNERAVKSLEEWQEFVEEWKTTLIGRLGELHKEVLCSNEKALAAQASEKEASDLLRAKSLEMNALLLKEQMQVMAPPVPPPGSRRPSNASQTLGFGASIANRFGRRPSNVLPSPTISEVDEQSPRRSQPQIRRRSSFGNLVSSILPTRRKSDTCLNKISAVPISELHPDLLNAVNAQAQPKDSYVIEMSSAASSISSVSSKPIAMTRQTSSCSRSEDEDDTNSVSTLSLAEEDPTSPREPVKEERSMAKNEGGSLETEILNVRKSTAEQGSQCFVPICHKGIQCSLFNEVRQSTPIGFASEDVTYIKNRGAGSVPVTPRLPAIRRFASQR